MRSTRLGELADSRANTLNFVRLCLAATVILWHSYPLTERAVDHHAYGQFISSLPVDGFFAISGFLITGSWLRRPAVAQFLIARVLRIYPAYWVCLIVTAFVLAPIGIVVAGQGFPPGFAGDAWGFVIGNGTLHITQWDIGGTPAGVPYGGAWNGSLWSLEWEFLCYLGVLGLGIAGLLRRKLVIAALFLMPLLLSIAIAQGMISGYLTGMIARFGVMFLAGVLIYLLRDLLPVTPVLLAGAGTVVAVSLMMSNYRIVGGLFLAYLLIGIGTYVQTSWLRLPNDISYGLYIYAFPVQQILAATSLSATPVPFFAVISFLLTIPLAALSWFVIEKPAIRLKKSYAVR